MEAPRSFRPLGLLVAADAASVLGNGVAAIAVPWIVLERTGSAAAAGTIAAIAAFPLVLAAFVGGALVDRIGRRRASVLSDVASAASVAAIPILDRAVGLDFELLAAVAVAGAIFDPLGITAREAMVPAVARRAGVALERVNAALEGGRGLGFLIGPALGGVLVGAVGSRNALWVTAGGFLVAAVAVTLIRSAGIGEERVSAPLGAAMREGVRFLFADPLLRTICLVGTALTLVVAPLEGLVLPVHFQRLDDATSLGIVLAAFAAGSIAGTGLYALVATRVQARGLFAVCLVLTALGVAWIALLPDALWLGIASALTGIAAGPLNAIFNLGIQRRTPEALRGRIIGTLGGLAYAAAPLGLVAGGGLIEGVGLGTAALVFAALFGVVTVVTVAAPGLRGLDTDPADRDQPAPPV